MCTINGMTFRAPLCILQHDTRSPQYQVTLYVLREQGLIIRTWTVIRYGLHFSDISVNVFTITKILGLPYSIAP